MTSPVASHIATQARAVELRSAGFSARRSQSEVAGLSTDSRSSDGRQPRGGELWRRPECQAPDAQTETIAVTPAEVVERRVLEWQSMGVEVIQCVTHDRVEFRFHARRHLLVVYEEGVREEGETLVDDIPRSTLRTLAGKLTFVPAGHDYREWQRPRLRSRLICFYFDPAQMPLDSRGNGTAMPFAPRLFFENDGLRETAVKLAATIEDCPEAERYSEALATVVAHELLCIHGHFQRRGSCARGGLAFWQQRILVAYVQEHLAEPVSLAQLAALVDLSAYHFCRAFKQSFGVTPHRYHIDRRIERAKTLLATQTRSVTETALELGFSETSSFSAVFRRITGITPTNYRRSLR